MNSAALKRIYRFSVPFPATFMIPGGAVHHCARAATTFVLLPSPPPPPPPVYTRCTGAGCDDGNDFRPSFHPYSTQTRDSRNLRHGFFGISFIRSLIDSRIMRHLCHSNHSFRWHPAAASALHIPADGHRTENKHERASGQFIRGCADGWESLP